MKFITIGQHLRFQLTIHSFECFFVLASSLFPPHSVSNHHFYKLSLHFHLSPARENRSRLAQPPLAWPCRFSKLVYRLQGVLRRAGSAATKVQACLTSARGGAGVLGRYHGWWLILNMKEGATLLCNA